METETPQPKRRVNQSAKQAKQRKSNRICIPIEDALYQEIVEDSKEFRKYPELFSEGMAREI